VPGFAAVNEQDGRRLRRGAGCDRKVGSVGLRDLPDKAQGVAIDHVGSVDWAAENVRVLNSGSGVVVDKGLVVR